MKKFAFFMATVMLILAVLSGTVLAEFVTAYDPVTPTNSSFTHTMTLTESPYTLGYTISYTFTPTGPTVKSPDDLSPTAVVDSAGHKVVEGNPVINGGDPVVYDPSTVFNSEHKHVTTVPVDWSGVTFREPGVYYWTVNKTVSSDAPSSLVSNEVTPTYLFAFVTCDPDTGELVVTPGSGGNLSTSSDLDEKAEPADHFPATTVDLELAKTVSGNQGSKDQYFPFQIQITEAGSPESHLYNVSGTYSSTADVKASPYYDSSSTIAVEQPALNDGQVDASKTIIIWLKHGENIKINDLPYGSSYTITEIAPGYDTEISVSGADQPEKDNERKVVSDTSLTAIDGTTVTYNNDRDVETPTGINLENGAPVMGMILAVVLLALVIAPKRKEENN